MTPILVACTLAGLFCSLYTIILPTWDASQAAKTKTTPTRQPAKAVASPDNGNVTAPTA